MKNQPFLTFYKSRSLTDHSSLVLDCDAPGVWQDKQARLLPTTEPSPVRRQTEGAQELESPLNVVADGRTPSFYG